MGKPLPLLNHENAEDVEFFGRQVDSRTANLRHSFFEIDIQIRKFDFWERLFRTEATQRGSNAREPFSDCLLPRRNPQ